MSKFLNPEIIEATRAKRETSQQLVNALVELETVKVTLTNTIKVTKEVVSEIQTIGKFLEAHEKAINQYYTHLKAIRNTAIAALLLAGVAVVCLTLK